ncbi:MAG TPA: tetratricopeptide repeat protein [Candidatus Omnitrophota bacterium]|nr:tetratricopeptide repeat protein [Candidatus Omnitrophota bacterium]
MILIKKLLPFLFITAIALAAYSNSFHVPFQFDDKEYIQKNPFIRDLGQTGILWFKDASHRARYVAYLTFALNYKFGQLDVFGFHFVNLCIHIINAFLVWWLVELTFLTPRMNVGAVREPPLHTNIIGLGAALLFVSHPLQTQAVTYIVQRFASLATLFYLLALCLYIKGRLSGRWVFFVGAAFSGVLGMFTKQIVLTLPFIIVLFEFTFMDIKRSLKAHKKVFLLLAVVLGLSALIIPTVYSYRFSDLLSAQAESASHYGDVLTIKTYSLTQLRVLLTYLRLLFLPINQNLDYDYPVSQSLFEAKALISFFIVLSIIISAILFYRRNRIVSFFILWFFIAASVESSFIVIGNVIFEHRAYLPSVGFFIALVAGVFGLFKNKNVGAVREPPLRLGIVIILAMVCSYLTYQRNKVWQTEFSLWDDVRLKSPNKARPYKNLGIVYAEAGSFHSAFSYLQKAHQLEPDDVDGINNLANVYNRLGDKEKAIQMYEEAIRLNPNHASAHNNLGSVYFDLGDMNKALGYYSKAERLNPIDPHVYYNLANVYFRLGEKDRAVRMNNLALQLDPGFVDAYQNLGVIYSEMDQGAQAMAYYQKALELNPGYAKVHNNIAALYFQQKNYPKAIEHVEAARRLGYQANPLFLKALEPYRAR